MNTETASMLFTEIQKSRQIGIVLLVLGIAALIHVLAILQIFFGIRVGNKPTPNSVIAIIWILVGFCLPIILLCSELRYGINDTGFHYQYFPFQFRERVIPAEEIHSFEAITYDPVKDYGGFGIRYWNKGRAFNTSGDKGVKINFGNDQTILFGTQKPEEFRRALESIIR